MAKTTRDMSDRHESWLQKVFGGRIQSGSGNQFHGQMDVRQSKNQGPWAFALDGKSTKAASIAVTREMWDKAVEQAHDLEPGLPLRFYDNARLTDALDLCVVEAVTLADLIVWANLVEPLRSCARGYHEMTRSEPLVRGEIEFCQHCGLAAYEASRPPEEG